MALDWAVISWIWHPNTDNKIKNRKIGLHENHKLLYIRGHHQDSEKTAHRVSENICKLCVCSGINIQNI